MQDKRKLSRLIMSGAALLVVSPVIGEFFVELAREQGLYEKPSAKVANAMGYLSTLNDSPWYIFLVGLCVGAAVALWCDYWLRRSRPTKAAEPEIDLNSLIPVVKGKYINETVQLDGHRFIQCTFQQVTFHYDGGLVALDDCLVSNKFSIFSTTPMVQRVIGVMTSLSRGKQTQSIDGRGTLRTSVTYIIPPTDQPNPPSAPQQPSSTEGKKPL